MIYIKNTAEIQMIREGGKRLSAILARLAKEVKPGAMTGEIEALALKLIKETGGRPAFKDYPMGGNIFFPSAVCVSINNEVVHGSALPTRPIIEGDIVDLDIGMEWPVTKELKEKYQAPNNSHSEQGGFYTDMCATIAAGRISAEAKQLLRVTEEALYAGIKQAKAGRTINDIARAVEARADEAGYGVVRDLVGHGVGYFAHEEPDVFNFAIKENSADNVVLKPGMVIAIEPMFNLGGWQVKIAKNHFTVLTADDSLSAHFEHTVAITEKGPIILTK